MSAGVASDLALALERARYPERFDTTGKRLVHKATAYRPARPAHWQTEQRPHATEERRLAAMLALAVTIGESYHAALRQCLEVAEAVKRERVATPDVPQTDATETSK